VRGALSKRVDRAVAAAASLTGKRFGLLVASSLVATSAIVAGAMTGTDDDGALAALVGRKLPIASAPASAAPTVPSGGGESAPSPRPAAAAAPPSEPQPAPAPSPAPAAAPSGEAEGSPSESAQPADPAPEPGRVGHVFAISLASPGYEAAFGAESKMPYLAATLRPQGELLTNYSLLDAAALPNGVATVSGQPPNSLTKAGCASYDEFPAGAALNRQGVVAGAGCVYPVEVLTVADQLTSARLRWGAYADGMADATGKPQNCIHPEPPTPESPVPGGYAATQNPFVYFHSLLDLGACGGSDLPLSALAPALRKANSTPNFVYVAPDPCDAGVPGQCPPGAAEGPASANAFLEQWVPQILASPAFKKDGVLVVTFGSADPPPAEPTPAPAQDPLHVGALVISQFATPGATDTGAYDPYSLLRSSEDLFGLEHLGLAAPAKVKSFAPALLGETGGD
jgi:hypothetical protein